MTAHSDTREEAWAHSGHLQGLRDWRPPTNGPVIVVAPHPDDETLGCGGLLSTLESLGTPTTVLLVSDGEAADADLDTAARRELSQLRRSEFESAMQLLAPSAHQVCAQLPDGGLADHEAELERAILNLVGGASLIVAPHPHDLHPDHEAVGRAAVSVAHARGIPLMAYGIWLWSWTQPGDPAHQWQDARILTLADQVLATKRAAIACYSSQLEPRLSDGPVLPPEVLMHHTREFEVYFTMSGGTR